MFFASSDLSRRFTWISALRDPVQFCLNPFEPSVYSIVSVYHSKNWDGRSGICAALLAWGWCCGCWLGVVELMSPYCRCFMASVSIEPIGTT